MSRRSDKNRFTTTVIYWHPRTNSIATPGFSLPRHSRCARGHRESGIRDAHRRGSVLRGQAANGAWLRVCEPCDRVLPHASRSEEHTSELQSLMRISYAVFCLKKKHTYPSKPHTHTATPITT